MQMITPSWVCRLGTIKNVFGLMTIGLGRIASRAFKLDTLEIPKVGFGKIRGSKPRMVGMITVPSWTDDKANLAIIGNVSTRGVNPPMVDGLYLFPESDDPRFVGVSTISSITTEEEGPRATWPRCFY